MAVQRVVETSFWDDEYIVTLSKDEKLLFLYLLTNPLTNIAGVYQITLRRISFDTGLSDPELLVILSKFEKDKKVYQHDGYMILVNWPKHQKYEEHSKIRKGIETIIHKLPDGLKRYMVSIGYTYPIIGYAYPMKGYHHTDSDSDSDSDSDTDIDSDSDTDSDTSTPLPPLGAGPPGPFQVRAGGLRISNSGPEAHTAGEALTRTLKSPEGAPFKEFLDKARKREAGELNRERGVV